MLVSTFQAPHRVPTALKHMRNWLCWRLIQKPEDKKPRKVPFYSNGALREAQGTDSDRAQLATYDEAVRAAEQGGYTGIGFAPFADTGIVALDFDDCVSNGVVDPNVLALVTPTYAEISPSGTGIRAFMRGSLVSRKDAKGDKGPFGVEFFGTNGFVTVTGNVLADCELFGTDQTVAALTPPVLAVYRQRFGEVSIPGAMGSESENDAFMLGLTPTLGWDRTKLVAMLAECDANTDRDHWLKALMAVHHETGGSDEGLEIADQWSATAQNYGGRADVEGRWRSFGKGGASTITGRWLVKWHAECTAKSRYAATEDWKRQIAASTDQYQLREVLCPQIAKDTRLDDIDREALAAQLAQVFKDVFRVKLPIATVRGLVAEVAVKTQSRNVVENLCEYRWSDLPKWVHDWSYITFDDKFYKHDSSQLLTTQGFNAKFNRELARTEDGDLFLSAAREALDNLAIPVVSKGVYAPGVPVFFKDDSGDWCINTFRPSSVPKAAEHLSEAGQRAVQVFKRHVDLICGGRSEVSESLFVWMAYRVQNPSKRVNWAPVIKGIEGDGKSYFLDVLGAVLGEANVGRINPTLLGQDFNGWAEGRLVVGIEEMWLPGANRYETSNALKPNISNDRIPIHRKGKDPYLVINTAMYFALTNYADAVPLTDSDRRYFVVFSPFNTTEQLREALAQFGGMDAYFNELFASKDLHADALRRWLLDYPIPATFNPKGRAPETDEKQQMVALNTTEEESVIREVIENGGYGIAKNVICSSALSNAVLTENPSLVIKTSAWNRLLSRLGWTKVVKKVKWDGAAHWIWVNVKVPTDQGALNAFLRDSLDKTKENVPLFEKTEDLPVETAKGDKPGSDLFG
ncbi:DNA primase [Curvibacter phage PCA1]|nr:DNA primase [Curvibacter phage PCA1]